MKKSILAGFLLIGTVGFAQMYGNGYGGGYGSGYGNPYGRSSMGMQPTQPREKTVDEIEKERVETVNKTVEKLKNDLTLDELQVVIVRKEFDASSKKINAVIKKEGLSQDEKMKEVQAINETAERNIINFLNDEQKKKFKEMIAERQKRMEMIKSKS